ncbi:MAG TPA: carbamoyltransferase C-terminal domain-containing protein [Stellaceae bacterium]|jgi:carbamoyltransferase
MIIIGINGGFDPVYERRFGFAADYVHDSAAVLLKDGEIVAGIEEERLTRIKHCNKSFFGSIRFCLDSAGIGFDDVDYFAFYVTEPFLDVSLKAMHLHRPQTGGLENARSLLNRMFEREFGRTPRPERLRFVNHHFTHAMSAYGLSGFDDSLILAIDGAGENISTLVAEMRDNRFTELATKPVEHSLGFFYLEVIRFLGYSIFDEYKVMGLAPYGDAGRFRELFTSFYTLKPDGDYEIHKERIFSLYEKMVPRRRGEEFNQMHKDVAAALQEALEAIFFHLLSHYRAKTGLSRLALAGGVAQNSTMNGKLIASGLFDDVYVSPSAADSGCSIGAALAVAHEVAPQRRRVETVYWGTDIGDNRKIGRALERWSAFLDLRRSDNVTEEAAELMARGGVIGWVQGRSEFGPRALGNRSILADPRPAEHKDKINAMIKKREAYRPFAPSVLAERAADVFEVPPGHKSFPFMSFVINVREKWRPVLGAITHTDGTARLQTVSREQNPRYWELISAFERRTGVPLLLNTSFNNNAEPIVDSVEDAVVCFLTSGLNYLVAGDWIARKKRVTAQAYLRLKLSLPLAIRLVEERRAFSYRARRTDHALVWNYDSDSARPVAAETYRLLAAADGRCSLGEIMRPLRFSEAQRRRVLAEIREIWSDRRVILRP